MDRWIDIDGSQRSYPVGCKQVTFQYITFRKCIEIEQSYRRVSGDKYAVADYVTCLIINS
jgi:hypothetical protein